MNSILVAVRDLGPGVGALGRTRIASLKLSSMVRAEDEAVLGMPTRSLKFGLLLSVAESVDRTWE